MLKVPTPRLLPATIIVMGALLALKCGILLQVAVAHGVMLNSPMVGAANAASTEQTKENGKPPSAPPGAPVKAVATPTPAPKQIPDGPPPVSDSEKALLQELRQRRQNLDQRADGIAARESVLIATEHKITARVDELQTLQKKLEGLDAAQKQKEDAGWQGLVKLYESMKPKDAATIFNDLSMPVLIQILDRMKDAKAAFVMAAMNPDKARDVTGELAQLRTGRDASGAPVAGLKTISLAADSICKGKYKMAIDKAMNVLIVDDYKTMLRIIRNLLKQIEFNNVEEASDGSDALSKLRGGNFGLVISDWNMAPMTGLQLLQEVRADNRLKAMPFIMITAESKTENVIAAKAAGVSNYIVKPFNAETLKDKIEKVLVMLDAPNELNPTGINALKLKLSEIRAKQSGIDSGMITEVLRAVLTTISDDLTTKESSLLREVEELGQMIANTKSEIAALRVDDITDHDIPFATDELDAIVEHTAHATDAILESCEMLDEVATTVSGEAAAKLQAATTKIYEACSFQDITGQRITKVVTTLKTIESKVAHIIGTFGATAGVTRVLANHVATDADLLNGPQLPAHAMDQSDIDKLLADFLMMCSRIPLAFALAVILVTSTNDGKAAVPDAQGPRLTVRSGNHPDFGRIVIDTSASAAYQIEQDGDHVVVRFTDDVKLGTPPAIPRNVLAITTDGPTVDLILKPGVKLHPIRLNGRFVLDILDAPANAVPPATTRQSAVRAVPQPHPPRSLASSPELEGRSVASTAAQSPTAAARAPVAAQPLLPLRIPPSQASPAQAMPGQTLPPQTLPTQALPPQASPAQALPAQTLPTQTLPPQALPPQALPAQTLPAPAPPASTPPVSKVMDAIQQTLPGRDVLPEKVGPVALLARRVKLPVGMDGSAFLVPFDSTTGAASFRSGDNVYLVFDERRPVDMSTLRNDPLFGVVSVQLLPNGTLFRIPLPATRSIALTQMPQGWRIAALPTSPKLQPIAVSLADGHLILAVEQAGDVVSLADPDTGATLLIGTQHRPGQGVAVSRRGAEFILRPTLQGVVVEPLADIIALKQIPMGFSLSGSPTGLLLSPSTSGTDGLVDAALLTRRLDFSTIPPEALMRRAVKQFGEAAASPPLIRGIKHHAAAQSLMSLGLAAEAESLLQMAAEQDPKEAASADTGALTAIAALLAGRPAEADALADPRLDGTDEISLWRAIRQAMQDDGSPSAAAVFAVTAPLVFQYPAPIREHILPLIVETMIKGGEIAPAARLLAQRKSDPKLAYSRALMKQAEGDTDQALGLLDALANGHDQFDRARAAIRAVELRLAARKIDKIQAADALDKLLYAWRGDARELALRERIADLRGETGAWRPALAILRQAQTDFPEQAIPIRGRLKDMFAAMIRDRGEQQIPPIDFVSTVDENADLMLDSSDDEAEQQSLADRLLALDLPDRAKPVLEKLMRTAKSPVAKARFGVSLATLQARDGNDAAARTTLDGSDGRDLPPDLVQQRTILRAESIAHLGDPAAATTMLLPLRTGPAIQARAQILESASDWRGAEQAWSENASLTLPESGMLDETQTRTVLRLTTATARAGDEAGLAGLRTSYGDRIGASPLGDMFRLLTVEPIRTTADIKRSQREMSLAASLPTDLKALQPRTVAR